MRLLQHKNRPYKEIRAEENKIEVLYPGISECFRAPGDDAALKDIRRKYNADSGYILHISSSDPGIIPRQLSARLEKAYQEAGISQKLIIAGNVDPRACGIEALIAESGLKDRVIFSGYFPEGRSGSWPPCIRRRIYMLTHRFMRVLGFRLPRPWPAGSL